MDSGGYGPGSYYVPLMVQFVFLFPLIEKMVYRYRFAGVVFFGGCNLLYEILQRLYGMGESCYRLLIFRYLLLIAYGCWLTVDRQKTKIWISFLCCGTGIAFVLLNSYTAYDPKVLIYWTGTSCIAVLYMLPFLGMLIRSPKFSTIHAAGLEWMGRASFHIYLFQMVYYGLAADKLYPLFPNEPAALIFSVVFCLMGGGLFYIIEKRISEALFPFLLRQTGKLTWRTFVNEINGFFIEGKH